MKNLLLLTCLSMFSLSFSQSKDLTKKEALQAFKNSELRKEMKITVSKFELYYKQAKCNQKYHLPEKEKSLRNMPIFQKKLDENYSSTGLFPEFGIDYTLPAKDENGNKVKCSEFNFNK